MRSASTSTAAQLIPMSLSTTKQSQPASSTMSKRSAVLIPTRSSQKASRPYNTSLQESSTNCKAVEVVQMAWILVARKARP
jgi:hypothetical protein